MPVYEYACEACGPFTALRPMAQFKDPHDCPDCGDAVRPRLPHRAADLAGMDAGPGAAHATNERSRHAPRRSSGHGAGCGCCTPKKATSARAAAKSFPTARPWMISH